ncbi:MULTISPECIES: hypothetical protein [unclassified Curtobacterium]|uniref:hypothetical protein n=1 Tax=unclassified Curtobacterium TaxID=257496 RepID=UPI00226BA0B9|nr:MULTISPECIES: hypothetical protein [unclassified Curtobacterium]
MNTRGDHVDTRAVGGDGPSRRARTAVTGIAAAVLAGALLVLGVAPAVAVAGTPDTDTRTTSTATSPGTTGTDTRPDAADTDSTDPGTTPDPDALSAQRPTASPSPEPARPGAPTSPPPTGLPPTDPTIADPGDVTSATGAFRGTATPGHGVRVMDPRVASASVCTATTDARGAWSCSGAVRSGAQQVFTVQDTTDPTRHTADAPAADVVVPPVITSRGTTTGSVSGSGDAGMTVTVTVSGSRAERTATVGSDGRWVVSWAIGAAPRPSGTVSMTATQTASTAAGYLSDLRSATSQPVSVTFDRTPPAPPRITSPVADARVVVQPLTVRGTGEAGAQLTVYVDRVAVCGTTVGADRSWSCSTAGSRFTAGRHLVSALQHDAAGNHSAPSASVRVVLAAAGASVPGSTPTGTTGTGDGPTSGTSGQPGHGSANGGTTGSPGTGGHDSDPGHHGGSGGTGNGSTAGGTTGTGNGATTGSGGSSTGGTTGTSGGTGTGGGTGLGTGRGPDWSGPAGDWTTATSFDHAVPTIQSSASWRTLAVAAAVAAGFLLLVAGPARLVARTLRGRVSLRLASVTGRNRPRTERTRGDDALPAWASIGIAVVLAGVLTLLAVGVSLEARYVRLAIAVLLGTAVLTAAVVLSTRWAAGADRHTIGWRVSPWLVLAALVACGVTRAADLSPALVIGVLLVPVGHPDADTGAMRLGAGLAACARSATWRSAGLLVLAAVGWVLHSLTHGTGFWTALVSEFAITLCVGGLGALVATLLPVAGSAGSALWAHSRARYAAVAGLGVALAAAVYSGSAGTHVPPVALAVVACASVAVAAGTWLWVRVLEPDLGG